MSVRVSPKPEYVLRCIPRQDGGYLIVTKKGSGSSPVELPEGTAILLENGLARKAT